VYSIGLIINVGHYYIVLAGDVENRTLKCIPDFNFDIQDRIDYVKIPHHASSTASYLIDKFNGLGIAAPTIATTTVYRIHKLPNKEVLKRYVMWDNDTKVYSTGDIECIEHDIEKNGIVQTTFDILEQRKKPIETTLFGNAICVSDIM
jgi:beta-lactamase superfamily II metal-dependent hydrolase